jgi:hypothetical protein
MRSQYISNEVTKCKFQFSTLKSYIKDMNRGRGTPSLLRRVAIVPTPRPCEGSLATFSRTACVAMSAAGGFRTLGTLNFWFSLYSVGDLDQCYTSLTWVRNHDSLNDKIVLSFESCKALCSWKPFLW